MDPFITTALPSLISASVAALVSGILTRAKAASQQQSAFEEGMRTLLKAELYDLHHRYVELEEPLDAMGLQLAAATYACYHDRLGGNGLGTKLYEEIAQQKVNS